MVKILVVPTKEYLSNKNNVRDVINTHGFYMERSNAETDSNFLQIIPYIVLQSEGNIFAYTRLSKGNETRLHNKRSIGIGGHIDEVATPMNLSNMDRVQSGCYTELFEEMDIETNGSFLPVETTYQCIYDPSNDVGKVHLGLLYICNVSGRTVSVKETDKIEGKFYTIEEIKSMFQQNSDAFETWSTIALQLMDIL